MSDTDDTDLLLLIPPDFFLVRSDLGSDSESETEIDHEDVKNSVVSDLIEHVNELESRICLIESFDRPNTQCSTCHIDDSIINLSVNSLTESDVLRTKNCNQKTEWSDLTLPFEHEKTSDLDLNPKNCLMLKQQEAGNVNPLDCPENSQSFYGKSHKEVLNEVDAYLRLKKSKSGNFALEENRNDSFNEQQRMNSISLSHKPSSNGTSLKSLDTARLGNHSGQVSLIEGNPESIALPQVYNLLNEMEHTQHEIERKLKSKDTKDLSQHKSFSNEIYKDIRSRYLLSSNDQSTSPFLPEKKNSGHLVSLDKDSLKFGYSSRKPIAQSPLDTSRGEAGFSRNEVDIMNPVHKKENSPRKNGNFRKQSSFDNYNGHLNTINRKSSSIDLNMRSEPMMERQPQQFDKVDYTRYRSDQGSNLSLEDRINAMVQKPKHFSSGIPSEIKNIQGLEAKISSSNLLSLSELWSKEAPFYSDDPSKLRQKLEEEKYRRQHCEEQIQQLQQRVLEQQERLAVAVRVDQEKDRAITEMSQSWRRLHDHWKELEDQKHSLAEQLHTERQSNRTKNLELDKKIERWEKEVSQALDLAAGYKEKSEAAQKQKDLVIEESRNKIEEANSEVQKLTEQIDSLNCQNKNLANDLEIVKERLKEEEELLTTLKNELEKAQHRSDVVEADLNVLKDQKDSLISKIKDEKSRRNILEQQKNSIEVALNEATKREQAAVEEARAGGERLEVARTELRALYQGQLESVVREKVQEFQKQLESAEAALRAELKAKEKQWAEKAADQCRQLHDKHRLELMRADEARREETNKWKERLMESERLRSASESRLQDETNRRADIAQRLHNVMETQWREALSIISNPLLKKCEMPKEENVEKWASAQSRPSGDSKRIGTSGSNEDDPFCREGLVTSRPSQHPTDDKLKKYIQMLLERGHPIGDDSLQDSFDAGDDDRDFASRWHDEVKKSNQNDRYISQSSKPPWK